MLPIIRSFNKFSKLFWSTTNNGITIVNIDNPEKKNALSKLMMQQMNQNLDEIAQSDSQVVIIKSNVKNVFCAGADLKERINYTDEETEQVVKNLRNTFHKIYSLPQPTIALIDGFALGGGLELALACDIRIATQQSQFGLPETALAIIPGAGGTQRTPRLIGLAKAKELIFTGRRINVQEALQIGLINYYFENYDQVQEKANEIANQILQKGPIAIRAAKKAINDGYNLDIDSGLQVEELNYKKVCYCKDRKEGLNSFLEKRNAKYKGE